MRNRSYENRDLSNVSFGNTKELQAFCGCGRDTAVKIGLSAGAKIKVGKSVIWNFDKVREYMNSISKGD